MAFTPIVDRAAGYALAEADWDAVKDALNAGVWVCLASTTLAAPAASIDFTSIPATHAHLMVETYLRGDTAALSTVVLLRLNNDSGANYDDQALQGQAAAVTAFEAFGQTSIPQSAAPAGAAPAGLYNTHTMWVPHYANTANNKAVVTRFAGKVGTTTTLLASIAIAGFWRSNAAISRVTILPTAGNWAAGSRAVLLGLP